MSNNKENTFERNKALASIFCLFFATLSIPGSESIVIIERANYLQLCVKATLTAFPFILLNGLQLLTVEKVKSFLTLLALGGYGILTSLWSPLTSFSVIRALSLVITVLSILAIVTSYIKISNNYKLLLLRDLCLATSIIILFFTVMGIMNFEIAWRKVYLSHAMLYRLGGDILPPNTLGALAAINFILSLSLFLYQKRIFYFLSIVASVYVMYFSNSRGAVFSLVFSWSTVFVIHTFAAYNLKRAAIIFIAISVIVGSFFFFEDRNIALTTIGFSRYGDLEELTTLTGRTFIWERIFEQDILSLLAGNGFGVLSKTSFVKFQSLKTTNAHNGFLQVIAGTGVIGFILFSLFLLNFVRWLIKNNMPDHSKNRSRNPTWSLLFLSIFVLINNFVESNFGAQIVPQTLTFLFVASILVTPEKKVYAEISYSV